ncbi:uncharacterized protein LOC127873787 [Dreissena polymorpha]|uniref:Uncharacterized protein n=1 Tax=Dreissena polymorpha TaxID=45954 RepID=A0A9D4KXI4_DREPO|nr:uncharacterized protein LOC127873787 [Dreissena polymorpha]KAH3847985.1 hypothetical protein DPMN_090321 [Dreissena polymorpha]
METSRSVKRSTTFSAADVMRRTSDPPLVARSMSVDGVEPTDDTRLSKFKGSFERRSIRRRPSKRFDRTDLKYGHDEDTYEAIRQRVFQERAVTNAIEALQERWNMLMFMYEDCMALNDEWKQRKLTKLSVKRQMELITIVTLFLVACIPAVVLMCIVCKINA